MNSLKYLKLQPIDDSRKGANSDVIELDDSVDADAMEKFWSDAVKDMKKDPLWSSLQE